VVFFNYTTMQMAAKIVYYGPGLCGKTTNLQHVHQKTAEKSRGEMISLETETDRTLFFDLLPLDVGVIEGMKVRLQLYTVPGQVFYNATRKLVLKGVDGIVFVADSQIATLAANVESFQNLKLNLADLGLSVEQVPIIFQYNKRDIRNILPVEELNETLNTIGAPYFEAAALHGVGVFETLKAISRLALTAVRKRLAEDSRKKAPVLVPSPPAPVHVPAPPPSAKSASPSPDPWADLVPDVHPNEVPLEFAEEDTDKKLVRPVETKAPLDIHEQLQKLRALASTPSPANKIPAGNSTKGLERRLHDILVPERVARQEVKRKANVEVPAHLLKSSSTVRLHLAFDGVGEEEVVRDAVTIKLVGNKKLERLTLHIDLEVKGKSEPSS